MTSLAPLALSISSQLIQDYLYIDEPPPPALAEHGSLVAIEGGLLAIDGNQVTHFELEPGSEGGWRTSAITVPVPPTAADSNIMQIKAFTINGNKDGGTPTSTLNLLCFFAANGWAEGGGTQPAYAVAWLVRETGGVWQDAVLSTEAIGLLSQVQSLDVFDAGAGEGQFVYGLTTNILGQANAQLFVLKIWTYNEITTAPWQIASQQVAPPISAGRAVFIASGDAGSPRPVSLCLAYPSDSGTTLAWTPPLPVGEESGPDISGAQWLGWASIPGTLREFLPLNGLTQWTAMAIDNAGLVHRLVFPTDTSQSCTISTLNQGTGPTNVTAVSVTRRVGQSMSMFAVADGSLWLTRDVETVNWVPLGDPVVQLATPGRDPTVFEVFYADPTASQANRIYHLSQDAANTVWKRQTLATFKDRTFVPGGSGPTEVGTISVELAATHQDTGQAAQNALVSVSSDQWVVLLADKLSYWVGPGTDQQIPADKLGLLTVRYQAVGLKFPHLTFYATEQGRPNSQTVGCRGDVVDGNANPSTSTVANRLAGNDKKFTLTTASLKAANLLPSTTSDDDDDTVGNIQKLGVYMVSHGAKGAAAPAPGAAKLELGSVWDDAGDALNWLSHAAEDLGTISVDVADDIATVTVGIYKVAVKTARQAADAIGMICARMMAGLRELEDVLKDLVEFLKMLFEWADILDTHKALKTLLSWGVNYLPANMPTATAWIDSRLSGLNSDITGAISKAEAYLKNNDLTLNGFAQSNNLATPGQSQPDLSGAMYQTHMTNHKSRCNYLLSRARPNMGAVTQKPASTVSIADPMNASFAKSSMTGQQATVLPALHAALSPNGPSDVAAVFDASARALLELSKDLIAGAVEGLEAVVNAVLGAIAEAAEWFASILADPLDIPVISWLYSALVEETLSPKNNDLSVLDLFCLILAVPVTVFYKLIRNGEAPFGGSRVAAMQAAFGDPAHTNFAALTDFSAGGAPSMSAAAGVDTAAEVLGCVAGCLTLFSGIVGTMSDVIALWNQTFEEETTPAEALVSWVSWALSTVSTLCEAPISIFAGFEDGADVVSVAKTVLFGLEVLPNIGDFICLVGTKTSLMREIPNSGAYWDAGCGFVILGAASVYIIAAAAEDRDGGWDYINAYLSNINRPFRFAMPWINAADPIGVLLVTGVILIADVAATVGGTVTQIGSSIRG